MSRRIAHLDMDAFYASVELLRYPQLEGLAVVVGGPERSGYDKTTAVRDFARLRDYAGRGVATTASYEARSLGVHSAMGLMKAAALAPDAVLLPADFAEYRRQSERFKAAVAEIAPHIEDRGIDEVYIDLTDVPGKTEPLARRIKHNVARATGLSCSIGIAPNKLLAKIASELDKPDGLTVLSHADIPARVWPLPTRRINGIGPKVSVRLEAIGIRTIGELARAPAALLVQHFGKHYGHWLVEAANGRDERPVITESEPKSRSRETTFERDLHPRRDRTALSNILISLCGDVSNDLVCRGYAAKTIGIKLRFDDFSTIRRDKTLAYPIDDPRAILGTARECLKRVPLDRRLRLLGVRAASLTRRKGSEPDSGLANNENIGEKTLRLFD